MGKNPSFSFRDGASLANARIPKTDIAKAYGVTGADGIVQGGFLDGRREYRNADGTTEYILQSDVARREQGTGTSAISQGNAAQAGFGLSETLAGGAAGQAVTRTQRRTILGGDVDTTQPVGQKRFLGN